MQQNTTHLTSSPDLFLERYTNMKRLLWAIGIMLLGVIIAGFWNYHLVDGFGRDFIAGRTIGDTGLLAGSYAENGRSEEHTSELQSRGHLVCRLLLEKKNI